MARVPVLRYGPLPVVEETPSKRRPLAHRAEAEGVMACNGGVEPAPAGRKAQDDNQVGTLERHSATLMGTAIAYAHSYRSNNGHQGPAKPWSMPP